MKNLYLALGLLFFQGAYARERVVRAIDTVVCVGESAVVGDLMYQPDSTYDIAPYNKRIIRVRADHSTTDVTVKGISEGSESATVRFIYKRRKHRVTINARVLTCASTGEKRGLQTSRALLKLIRNTLRPERRPFSKKEKALNGLGLALRKLKSALRDRELHPGKRVCLENLLEQLAALKARLKRTPAREIDYDQIINEVDEILESILECIS